MKQKSTSKPGSISDKLCALSTRNKGLLALLVTISAALCIVICGLIILGFGTSSVAAYYHSLEFVETTCVVTVSSVNWLLFLYEFCRMVDEVYRVDLEFPARCGDGKHNFWKQLSPICFSVDMPLVSLGHQICCQTNIKFVKLQFTCWGKWYTADEGRPCWTVLQFNVRFSSTS